MRKLFPNSLLTFVFMIHRGEIIEKAIRESGYSITTVAQRLGKSRRWMYLLFENPAVSIELILQIGKLFTTILVSNFLKSFKVNINHMT